MAKAQRKALERLNMRRKHYDELPAHLQAERKRPGSMKKSQPRIRPRKR